MTPGGERSGAGGRTCCSRPGGKGLGGNGLGGLVCVWVGLAWARYFALSLPTAAAAAAAGEASMARAGFFPRLRGVLGVAAWPAEAMAQPAGAAVATPRAPSSPSSATVAAAGEAPVALAGSVPRVRGVLGVAGDAGDEVLLVGTGRRPPAPPECVPEGPVWRHEAVAQVPREEPQGVARHVLPESATPHRHRRWVRRRSQGIWVRRIR